MARKKSPIRRVLNGRFLRWWALRKLCALFPALGMKLGFFPRPVTMIEAADEVLVDITQRLGLDDVAPDGEFVQRCAKHDTIEADFAFPDNAYTGDRLTLHRDTWIDTSTGYAVRPARRETIILRGQSANWNMTSARWNRPKVRLEGRVTFPVRATNYYHLMVENGLRLMDLVARPELADAPLTLAHAPPGTAAEEAMYRVIANSASHVGLHQVARDTHLIPDETVCFCPRNNNWEWSRFERATAQRFAAGFRAHYGNQDERHGPKLYISRAGVKLRGLRNGDELERALAERGFEIFVANGDNHPEQIARFASARQIVSIHGAGLTNLIFARPGAQVVEIFPSNFVKSPYWWISRQMGLEYRWVIGGPGDYDQNFPVEVADVNGALDAFGTG